MPPCSRRFYFNKGFCHFPVSRHFPGRSVPPCPGRFCFNKGFCHFPVSRHVPFSKVSRNRKTTKSLEKKTLISRDLVVLPVSRHFFVWKVSRNSQTTKSLEIMTFQGILLFLLFLDTFHIQGDLSFPLFPDTSTELSAAGAKRGVCNCIRTTIPSRPASRRPARA